MNTETSRGFQCRIIAGNLVGYLLATVPQLVIDPKLSTHVRYGAREYPHGWFLVMLMMVLVGVASWWLSSKCRQDVGIFKCCAFSVAPLLGASLLSIPVFEPEVPHMNLISISLEWSVLTVIGVGLSMLPSWLLDGAAEEMSEKKLIEFVRESAIFVRNVLIGSIIAYFGFIITALKRMHFVSMHIVIDKGEQFLLISYDNFAILIISLFFFFNVIIVGLSAWRSILRAMRVDAPDAC